MQTDVIIIGAGVAGLSAALELKKHKISYVILEAQAVIGGRAASITTASGTAVDLGAHWFHGKHNPLQELLDNYGIKYRRDRADNMYVFENGKGKKVASDWLENLLNDKIAGLVAKGKKPDRAVPELAKNKTARGKLDKFVTMWDGLDPPLKPSAREYLNDKSVPGGLQLPGGIGVLLARMSGEVGRKNILLKQKVAEISSNPAGVEIRTTANKTYRAKLVVFTASLGVIKSNITKFKPGLTREFRSYLATIAMGKMNKIVVELKPEFFEIMGIKDDTSLELLDGDWPHFCHVKSAGNPLISLFISGPRASKIEKLNTKQALAYLHKVLQPVNALFGYEAFIQGQPIITKWVGNPYIKGSYSACLPGAERAWPCWQNNVLLAGDTFDKEYPGSMAGAYRSGKAAALMAREKLG